MADDQGRAIIRTGGPQTMREDDKRFSVRRPRRDLVGTLFYVFVAILYS